MWKETGVTDIKVFYRHFLGGTEGYHENDIELQWSAESES